VGRYSGPVVADVEAPAVLEAPDGDGFAAVVDGIPKQVLEESPHPCVGPLEPIDPPTARLEILVGPEDGHPVPQGQAIAAPFSKSVA